MSKHSARLMSADLHEDLNKGATRNFARVPAVRDSVAVSSAAPVRKALRLTGRTDLIGYGKGCLIRPDREAYGRVGPGRTKKGKYG